MAEAINRLTPATQGAAAGGLDRSAPRVESGRPRNLASNAQALAPEAGLIPGMSGLPAELPSDRTLQAGVLTPRRRGIHIPTPHWPDLRPRRKPQEESGTTLRKKKSHRLRNAAVALGTGTVLATGGLLASGAVQTGNPGGEGSPSIPPGTQPVGGEGSPSPVATPTITKGPDGTPVVTLPPRTPEASAVVPGTPGPATPEPSPTKSPEPTKTPNVTASPEQTAKPTPETPYSIFRDRLLSAQHAKINGKYVRNSAGQEIFTVDKSNKYYLLSPDGAISVLLNSEDLYIYDDGTPRELGYWVGDAEHTDLFTNYLGSINLDNGTTVMATMFTSGKMEPFTMIFQVGAPGEESFPVGITNEQTGTGNGTWGHMTITPEQFASGNWLSPNGTKEGFGPNTTVKLLMFSQWSASQYPELDKAIEGNIDLTDAVISFFKDVSKPGTSLEDALKRADPRIKNFVDVTPSLDSNVQFPVIAQIDRPYNPKTIKK